MGKEVAVQTREESVQSRFTGGAFSNFFRGFAVAIVGIITLGLAFPAMLCWKLRWEMSHTYIDGRRLAFDGKGIQLLGKFLLWVLLSIVTIGIYLIFCMPLNMQRWTKFHTHFEGQTGASSFDGHIWQMFGVRFVAFLVTVITLGLGSFWAHCYRERWYAKHTVYDGVRMRFDGTGWQYFGKRIVWLLLTVITIGIYSFWLIVKSKKWTVSHTHGVA